MSKETLENLPIELQEIIFSYAIKCKKDQNFYINKDIVKLLVANIILINCGSLISVTF